MYFVWNDTFCAVVYTSKGEIAIRRVNGIWSEYDVRSLVGIKEPDLIMPDIYPVELFSVSEHKFICAAWSIEDAENQKAKFTLLKKSEEAEELQCLKAAKKLYARTKWEAVIQDRINELKN